MNKTEKTDELALEEQGLKTLKRLKWLSIILGAWMFLFGFLKLFPPASGWFETQIKNSGLPLISIPLGIATEMLVGALFLVPWFSDVFSFQRRRQINVIASLILIAQMSIATYVHLNPNVPAGVLPLGFKPPIIPLTVLLLAATNGLLFLRLRSRGPVSSMS